MSAATRQKPSTRIRRQASLKVAVAGAPVSLSTWCVCKSVPVVTTGTLLHTHHVDKLTGAPATATFKEACRLIRVDGFWRVAADIENDYFGLLATGDGTT